MAAKNSPPTIEQRIRAAIVRSQRPLSVAELHGPGMPGLTSRRSSEIAAACATMVERGELVRLPGEPPRFRGHSSIGKKSYAKGQRGGWRKTLSLRHSRNPAISNRFAPPPSMAKLFRFSLCPLAGRRHKPFPHCQFSLGPWLSVRFSPYRGVTPSSSYVIRSGSFILLRRSALPSIGWPS